MTRIIFILFFILPRLGITQDPREFNHGTCIVAYENANDSIKYYLTWSSSFDDSWQHDIYNSTIYFDLNGNLITEEPNQLYIGNGSDEAQEPINSTINTSNNTILSVWEDGIDTDGPNVRGQIHSPDGTILKVNWIIAGGLGSQHSANTSHLTNNYLVFYADEAPPSTGGAVLKAKVIDDLTGVESQTISFTPNNEDHWWPVSVSNSANTRTLIIWGNGGYAIRGTVLFDDGSQIQQTNPPQDYLTNTQQYFYQVEWLDSISQFLLIARNGADNSITNESQVCLIDTLGNITDSKLVAGGILREAKMIYKWNSCNQTYSIFYPSSQNNLTQLMVDEQGGISTVSNQIVGHPDLASVTWSSTGIWSTFVTDINGNDLFNDHFQAIFIQNDELSNDLVEIPTSLDTALFCGTLANKEIIIDDFFVYPNPTSNKIILPANICNSNYSIYSTTGELITAGYISDNSISVSSLPCGIYYINITESATTIERSFTIFKEKSF